MKERLWNFLRSDPVHLAAAAVLSPACVYCTFILLSGLGVAGTSILYAVLLAAFLCAFVSECPGRRLFLFCYLFSAAGLLGLRLEAGFNLGGTSCLSILISSLGFGRTAAVLTGKGKAFVSARWMQCRKAINSEKSAENSTENNTEKSTESAADSRERRGGAGQSLFARYCSLPSWERMLLQTAAFFLCWLPVLFAFWPGNAAYDSWTQLGYLEEGYSTHHPLLHSLLLNGCYLLGKARGDVNEGIALYCLIQMTVLAASFSYLLLFLERRSRRAGLCTAVFLFLALMPLVSLLSISVTKDVLFAAMLTVSFVCVCDFCMEPELLRSRGKTVIFLLSSVLMCLLRNQGIILIAAVLIILLTAMGGHRVRVAAVGLCILLSYGLISQGLIAATDASSGSANEALSLPYQQIARTYVMEQDSLTEETLAAIETILPDADRYDPSIADPVKKTAAALDDPGAFLEVYTQLLVQYPFRYLEAVLYNDLGFWYVGDQTFLEVKGKYLEFQTGNLSGIERSSRFPALERLYEGLFGEDWGYTQLPVLAILFQPALYLWVCLWILIRCGSRKSLRVSAAPAAMVVVFLATILAGPCVLPRYVFPLIPLLPALYVCMEQGSRAVPEAADRSPAAGNIESGETA